LVYNKTINQIIPFSINKAVFSYSQPKMGHKKFIEGVKKATINKPFYIKKIVTLPNANSDGI